MEGDAPIGTDLLPELPELPTAAEIARFVAPPDDLVADGVAAVLGASARVTLDCGFPLVAMVTRSTAEEFKLASGLVITAAIKAGAVHLVSRQGD